MRALRFRKIMSLGMVATMLALAACNTVQGVGRDLESVGETVEDAAN